MKVPPTHESVRKDGHELAFGAQHSSTIPQVRVGGCAVASRLKEMQEALARQARAHAA